MPRKSATTLNRSQNPSHRAHSMPTSGCSGNQSQSRVGVAGCERPWGTS